jgi:hypothetical protein
MLDTLGYPVTKTLTDPQYSPVITRQVGVHRVGIGPLLNELIERNDTGELHDRILSYVDNMWFNNKTFFIDHDRSIAALFDWGDRYGWNHRIDMTPSARYLIDDHDAYWLDYGNTKSMLYGVDALQLLSAVTDDWLRSLDVVIGDEPDIIPYVFITCRNDNCGESAIRRAIWYKHHLGSFSMTVDACNTYTMLRSMTSGIANEEHEWELYADHVLSRKPSPTALTNVTIMIIGSIFHMNEHNLNMNKVLRSVEYLDGLLPAATGLANAGVPATVVMENAIMGDYIPVDCQ